MHYSKDADGLCCRVGFICPQIEDQAAVDLTGTWEVERKSLQFIRELGSTKHGNIWEGVWNTYVTTPVAIEIPKPAADSRNNGIILAEIQILKKLRHQNIIQLYAVCSIDEPAYAITELMKNGNLQDYLQKGEGCHMVLDQLIDIASQIASGMSYLEEHNYIHRDLCTRNVLVGEENIVKISNFGMAKVKEYILTSEDDIGAVKWTAPEVFLLYPHDIKSDVWSFGIVLVELVTYGQPPYPDLTNDDVIKKLNRGYRMPPPPECPDPLYQIMMDCWKQEPGERLTFEFLKYTLQDYNVATADMVQRQRTYIKNV